MYSLRLLAGVLLAFLLFSPVHASPTQFSGKTITQIVLKDDHGVPWPRTDQVLPFIVVKQGIPLAGTEVREGIALLYLKGLFSNIQVEAFPDGNGVRLEYILTPAIRIDGTVVKGNHTVSSGALKDLAAPLDGKELREEKLSALKADILALYQAEGFYEAAVAVRTEPLKEPHRVSLVIDVEESDPVEIEELVFTGNTVFTEEELTWAIKSRRGARLKRDQLLDADREAILKKYAAAGYPAAKSGPVDISFRGHKAFVHIQCTEGPKATVSFSGNHAFGDRKLNQSLLIWTEHDISDAVIESSAEKIKSLYREHGYADALVDVKKNPAPGQLNLEFMITEGPRVTVKEILLRGTTVFTADEIKGQMALRESGWFFSKPFREDLLDKDLDYLRDRYLDAGYLSVSAKKSVERGPDGRSATVTIEVAEGPRTMAGEISVEGNKALASAELLPLLVLKQGAPFNERTVDEDRYRILTAYANKGYLYARVDVEKTQRDGAVDVRYRIAEDLPVTIGRIILRGNERTRDRIIMRELQVKTGDAYDYGALLGSQQRIYRLGYFRTARFEPVHPGEKEYTKDMLLSLEERSAGAVEIGAGYGDLDRLRGFVEVSHRNLWGTARYSSLRYEESDILKRAIFNFQEPWFLDHRLDAKFSLVWSDSEKLNSDTRETYYKTRKTSAAFGVERSYEKFKPSLTYQFENVVNYDVKPEAQLTPEDSGRVLVSSVSPALIWDLRDDMFNPRRGAIFGIVLKEASRLFWSQVDFSKLTVQASVFMPLGDSVVTAFSARMGLAWPYHNTGEVPLHERFYMGGSTTVRGYTQDSIGPSVVGPNGDPIPIGGSGMAALNFEVRVNPGEGPGFVLFTDAGNIWPGQEINLNHLRSSYGAGFRYGTPIGPLRIDYGQKIHRQPGEAPGELHFNIGHTF